MRSRRLRRPRPPRTLRRGLWCGVAVLAAMAARATSVPAVSPTPAAETRSQAELDYPIAERAWIGTHRGAIRGVTVGPIENQLHPGRGYGSPACARTMQEVRRLGGNWVSLTPFGRVWDTASTGISSRFELPYALNCAMVKGAIAQAHAEGLSVLLVPHLWVESGQWRAELDPKTDDGWASWEKSYLRFLLEWARLAEESGVDMLAVGVEMRRWLTTSRAPSFFPIIEQVRRVYSGPLTYAANWDDADDTVIWGALDAIGINAFYPLSDKEGAELPTLISGAERVVAQARNLAEQFARPVLFTEFGYTTRTDPAVRPWEWPESLTGVAIDERAQALAYRALLSAVRDQSWFMGVFVWRFYADPDDVSQEPEWGFSPRGKLAELELRDAFSSRWAADGNRRFRSPLAGIAASHPGVF